MLTLYTASLVRAIGWVGTLTYVGAYLGEELGFSTSEIGWAYMVSASGYFLGTTMAGRRYGGMSLRSFYALSTSACGLLLGMSIALPLSSVATVAVLTVGAIGGGIGWVLLVTLLSSETSAGQGTTMSLNQTMFQVGSALGALLGGGLIALGGYSALAIGLMGFMSVAAVIVWRPMRSEAPVSEPAMPSD